MLTEERLVGARIRVAVMIAAALFIFAVFAWLLVGGTIFQPKETLFTYVTDSGGLDKGAPVRMNGLPVGKVGGVRLARRNDRTRVIEIKLRVQKRYLRLIPRDSTTNISSDNILGDKFIDINRGKSSEPVKPEDELRYIPPSALFNRADLLQSFETTLKQMDALLADIEAGRSRVGQFVRGEDFYHQINAKIGQIATQIGVMASPKGPLGQMIYRDEIHQRIVERIRGIDQRIAALQSNPLISGSADYEKLRSTVNRFRRAMEDVQAGKGPAGALMESDELYSRINRTADSLNTSIDALISGQGQLGQLMATTQMYESLEGKTRAMEVFLRELRTNPRKFLRIQVGF